MKKIKEVLSKITNKNLAYFLLTGVMIIFLWSMAQFFNVNHFVDEMEAKSYDLRFRLALNNTKPNSDVIILTVDDSSLEIMEEDFGRWPWNRDAYLKAIDYLESGGVGTIAFDLMFIGHQKGFENVDAELAKTIASYKNIYISMNFDNRDNINPPVLPDRLKATVENNSKTIDFSSLEFINCRLIMQEILDSAENIGIINFKRDIDGISRRAPSFIKYNGDLYPYLAVKVAQNYIKKKEGLKTDSYKIDKNNNLVIGSKKVPLDKDGLIILNWYGADGAFERVPLYKVIKSIKAVQKGLKPEIPANYFKDKVVFIGVTATSLFDIKSVPLSSVYPGVEIQTTAFNNIVDGNSIYRTNAFVNILISVFLIISTGFAALKIRSSFLSTFVTMLIALFYMIISSLVLKYLNVWVDMVYPLFAIILTFTIMYIIKYINKSRDFEYTYKLATTDGLTSLYNHRYFQEQMTINIENSKRYNSQFSLLLIDIDFFKKFNDSYGHQAGDAVLRQVAQLLKRTVRATDLVARYGGEEMTIILSNTNIDEAYAAATKICKAIAEKPFKLSDTVEKHVTISIGVATFPQHASTSAELIEFSDQGLYSAKENGRNRVGDIPGYDAEEKASSISE